MHDLPNGSNIHILRCMRLAYLHFLTTLLESGCGCLDFFGAKPQTAVLHYDYYPHWIDISFLVHINVSLPVSSGCTPCFADFTVFRTGIRIGFSVHEYHHRTSAKLIDCISQRTSRRKNRFVELWYSFKFPFFPSASCMVFLRWNRYYRAICVIFIRLQPFGATRFLISILLRRTLYD